MYQQLSGMNSVFPGNAPMATPMYTMMNPMYAMQHSYQNRAMMMPPQNMYSQMQVVIRTVANL